MSFLGKLRSKTESLEEAHLVCPFCGENAKPLPTEDVIYRGWSCGCGAQASGAPSPDFDEAMDELLARLGLTDRVSEQVQALAGDNAYANQPFSVSRARGAAERALNRAGYQAEHTCIDHLRESLQVLWARKRVGAN